MEVLNDIDEMEIRDYASDLRIGGWQRTLGPSIARRLLAELDRTRDAIRKHRDQRGDDRCWMDDEELYRVLPEGYTPPERDSTVELENCKRYITSRHNPNTVYVSPEREIERLNAEHAELREALDSAVSLLAHYAKIENDRDDGLRYEWTSGQEFLEAKRNAEKQIERG